MRARVLSLFLLLLALAVSSPALAQDRAYSPLDRLLPEIRRHTPGTFYDAQGPVPGPDGQMRYHIKWMTPEGRIVWFDVDARSGHILGGGYPQEGYPQTGSWPSGGRMHDGDRWGDRGDHSNGDRDGDRDGRRDGGRDHDGGRRDGRHPH